MFSRFWLEKLGSWTTMREQWPLPLTGRDAEGGCKASYLLSMFDCSAEPQHRIHAKG